ncbi:MAG: hypothetical protein LBS25_08655 [Candidatus Symbiothrix sp.]|nr:hypothetical protein [Candidatus Symbiothrix sp.]
MKKVIHFYEVKRNPRRINLAILEQKSKYVLSKYSEYNDYEIKCIGLSMEDM